MLYSNVFSVEIVSIKIHSCHIVRFIYRFFSFSYESANPKLLGENLVKLTNIKSIEFYDNFMNGVYQSVTYKKDK